jgi:hypothetical protein
MIYFIIIGLVIAYLSLSFLFKPADKPVASGDKIPPKAVILSPAAQLFLQKYGFQNNYRNDNAITICMSAVSIRPLYPCYVRHWQLLTLFPPHCIL